VKNERVSEHLLCCACGICRTAGFACIMC